MVNYDKLIQRYKNKVQTEVPEPNRRLILDFAERLRAEELSSARILEYLRCLYRMALMLDKPFAEATEQDLVRLVNAIKNVNVKYRGYSGKEPIKVTGKYSESYVLGFKVTLKRFYKWLEGGSYPKKVDWIKCSHPSATVSKDDILTEEEIMRVINTCVSLRDRCFIHLTYETGARIGEVRPLRRRDIEFTNDGALVSLKTEKKRGRDKGETRTVPVVYCVPSLVEYVNSMIDKSPEAYLWVGHGERNTGRLLETSTLEGILKKAARKAGIRKRCYPHLLRFSRATHLSPHLTESVMRNLFGWSEKSLMPSHYARLSSRQAQDSLLRNVYGIENNGSGGEALFCGRCKAKLQEGAEKCWRCNLILNEKLRREEEKKSMMLEEIGHKLENFNTLVDNRVKELISEGGYVHVSKG